MIGRRKTLRLEEPTPTGRKDDGMKGKYTLPNSGKKSYGGWSIEGLKRFEALRKEIEAIRKKEAESGYKLEQKCLGLVRKKHGIEADTWEEHNGSKAPSKVTTKKIPKGINVEVHGDEDDEFQDSSDDSDTDNEE